MGSLPAAAGANQFGKYRLVARLASGGMAEIFLARLTGAAGFEKLVCIKRILPHLARDRQFVAMFLDEARIAARISHPNVCQVFELGEIDGSYYLAMEYLEGVPLACFRRHDYYGPVPDPRLVAGIAIHACEGLHHAHQLKTTDGREMEVVHRDVSPQNLFVTTDGIVKVLDFGIAKITDATVRTTTGAIKGTYAYMAPEQLRGERLDRRTDVFAMGIVLWETLARRHLFKRDTEFLTFQAITSDPIEDICTLRPDVPPALSAVIKTALARDRDSRFSTARALGEAIAAAISPLTAGAISEELQRAFPVELAEQAELIRVAREGGVFDLAVERGPAVGHGAELLTTPVSQQRAPAYMSGDPAGLASAPREATGGVTTGDPAWSASAAGAVASAAPARISAAQQAVAPARISAAQQAVAPARISAAQQAVAPARISATQEAVASARISAAQPVVGPTGRSWRPLALAAVAIAVGGAAAVVYVRIARDRSREAPGAPVQAGAPVAAARSDTPLAGSSVPSPSPPDAPRDPSAVATAPPQSAGSATAPQPPRAPSGDPPRSASAASAAAEPRAASAAKPVASAAARPSGPPGYITIDSSPVYAVIYIDGKKYGETPLVKLELPPGRHVVHAVAPSGETRDTRITIESGKAAATLRIGW